MYDFPRPNRSLDEPRMAGREAQPAMRAAPREATLSRRAIAWMAALPAHARPTGFAVRFPQLANWLAAAWPVREECRACFDALLRGGRAEGEAFPPRVALELTRLEHYYDSLSSWALRSIWNCVGAR
jgi:hypothetical protein